MTSAGRFSPLGPLGISNLIQFGGTRGHIHDELREMVDVSGVFAFWHGYNMPCMRTIYHFSCYHAPLSQEGAYRPHASISETSADTRATNPVIKPPTIFAHASHTSRRCFLASWI
jgi:hypothetical protein